MSLEFVEMMMFDFDQYFNEVKREVHYQQQAERDESLVMYSAYYNRITEAVLVV